MDRRTVRLVDDDTNEECLVEIEAGRDYVSLRKIGHPYPALSLGAQRGSLREYSFNPETGEMMGASDVVDYLDPPGTHLPKDLDSQTEDE